MNKPAIELPGSPAAAKRTAVDYMLAPLHEFFNDPSITEICINEPYIVFVEKSGHWEQHRVDALSYDFLKRMGVAVATYANTMFSDASPVVSAVLPNGERSQFVMPPACKDDTVSVTIRKPGKTVRAMDDYITGSFFDHIVPVQEMNDVDANLCNMYHQAMICHDPEEKARLRANFLIKSVEMGKNIVIAGETGSGKTTFMKALMQAIPVEERIITIEDVPELMWGLPNHKNQVNLLYPSEATESSTITAASLMRSCLRMKPDRILLAELRGGETFDFLNVCLSGHGGTITSCHAGTCKGVFDYLGLKVMQSPVGQSLPFDVIMKLLSDVLDIVVCIHNDKKNGRGRHITELFFNTYEQLNNKQRT